MQSKPIFKESEILLEAAKALKAQGVEIESVRFKAIAFNGTLHSNRSYSCSKPARAMTEVTWQDVYDNQYRICIECGHHLSHPGGWTEVRSAAHAVLLALGVGDAIKKLRSATSPEETAVHTKSLAAWLTRQRNRNELNVPKQFRPIMKTRLKDFAAFLDETLEPAKERQLMLSLLESHSAIFEPHYRECEDKTLLYAPAEPRFISKARGVLKSPFQSSYIFEGSPVSTDVLVWSLGMKHLKGKSAGVVPTHAHGRLLQLFGALSAPTDLEMSERAIETFNVLCQDSPPQTPGDLSERALTAFNLER